MPAYVIAQVEVKDRETYETYLAESIGLLEGFPATVLVSDDNPDPVEGDWAGPRTVVVEFPSKADARAWYESEQYQRTIALRNASTVTNLVIASGVGD